jgi:hypothetical protein
LELRSWERAWLADKLRQGLLPHGIRNDRWQHSPLVAEPLWEAHDPELVSRFQVAELIRDRMRVFMQAERDHKLGHELLSQWLGKFRPEKLHLFRAGLLTCAQVLSMRTDCLLPIDGQVLQGFKHMRDEDVDACCDGRRIKFASAPYGDPAVENDVVEQENLLTETQWNAVPVLQMQIATRTFKAPRMSDDEFATDDLTFGLRLHLGWCEACDPGRQRAVWRVGMVARLMWGPMEMSREYDLGG